MYYASFGMYIYRTSSAKYFHTRDIPIAHALQRWHSPRHVNVLTATHTLYGLLHTNTVNALTTVHILYNCHTSTHCDYSWFPNPREALTQVLN